MPKFLSLAATVLFLSTTVTAFDPQLRQVHVIARHGARTTLHKNPNTLLEREAQSRLTAIGEKQLYDLGVWLRKRYYESSAPDLEWYTPSLKEYNPSFHRLESSALDRTLTSANAIGLGLFPDNGDIDQLLPHSLPVPVYATSEFNDIVIRSYRNCPEFHKRLLLLYQSEQWRSFQKNHEQLLEKLADKFPEKAQSARNGTTILPLQDLWNVYDPIHVARTECIPDDTTQTCQSLENTQYLLEALTDSEFDEMEQLTHSAERMKFGVGTAGNLLGSNLLWQILGRATAEGTMYVYAAHSSTMLGFLSALKEQINGVAGELFIEYGSAIIMEIYFDDDSQNYSVRLLYKPSTSDDVPRYLPLDHMDCAIFDPTNDSTSKEYCDLPKMLQWAADNTITTQEDWCDVCGNDSADVCMFHILYDQRGIGTILKNSPEEAKALAGSFFGGLAAGLLLCALCFCGCRYCSSKGGTAEKEELPPSASPIGMPGGDEAQEQAPHDHEEPPIVGIS